MAGNDLGAAIDDLLIDLATDPDPRQPAPSHHCYGKETSRARHSETTSGTSEASCIASTARSHSLSCTSATAVPSVPTTDSAKVPRGSVIAAPAPPLSMRGRTGRRFGILDPEKSRRRVIGPIPELMSL